MLRIYTLLSLPALIRKVAVFVRPIYVGLIERLKPATNIVSLGLKTTTQAQVFVIDIDAYTIMSNHYYVVLHINKAKANA